MNDRYPILHGQFRWQVPEWFNIAEVCSRRWARQSPQAVAVIQETEALFDQGPVVSCTYATLQARANQLSHALTALGVRRGDRVAVVMPQRIETAVAHIALYQMGAVAMPLSMLFGPDALEYRLQDSEAVAAIADETSVDAILLSAGNARRWPSSWPWDRPRAGDWTGSWIGTRPWHRNQNATPPSRPRPMKRPSLSTPAEPRGHPRVH